MAHRGFPRDPGLISIHCLLQYQDQMARFTMRPIAYDVYSAILSTFSVYDDEFHCQMRMLLQSPSFEYLRIFWDVIHRGINGEELIMLDNTLFLYPVAQYFLLKRFLYLADLSDPHWNGARELDREQDFILSTLSAAALNIIRRRRLRRIAVRDRTRARNAANSDPSENFICFLSFCQEFAARLTMRPADYQLYARLTQRLRTERISYVEFVNRMTAMLRNPNYRALRVWWNIHRLNVLGVTRMEENPLLLYPLDLCVKFYVHRFCAMFGITLWSSYLNNLRRQREFGGGDV